MTLFAEFHPVRVFAAGEAKQAAAWHNHGIAPVAATWVEALGHLFHEENRAKCDLAVFTHGERWFCSGCSNRHFGFIGIFGVFGSADLVDIVIRKPATMCVGNITMLRHALELGPFVHAPIGRATVS